MKAYIIAFLLVLCVTCCLSDMGAMPYPWPVGISGVHELETGTKRESSLIPEINYTAGARPAAIITQVRETKDREFSDFSYTGQ